MRKPLLRVLILGNSSALRVRPPSADCQQKVYGARLEHILWANAVPAIVINESSSAGVVSEAIDQHDYMTVRHTPDVVLVHYGFNEAVPRFWPRPIHQWLNRPRPRAGRVSRLLLEKFNGFINKLVAPRAIRWLGLRPWYSPRRFQFEMAELLRTINKETRARTCVIGIAPATVRIEALLPGSNQCICGYNRILRDVAQENGAGFIDLHTRLSSERIEEVVADGIHLTARGHEILAAMLAERIITNLA